MPIRAQRRDAAVKHRLDLFGVLVLFFAAGNSGGIARDVSPDVAGKNARTEVVVAADRVADEQLDGLAAVEVSDRLRRHD